MATAKQQDPVLNIILASLEQDLIYHLIYWRLVNLDSRVMKEQITRIIEEQEPVGIELAPQLPAGEDCPFCGSVEIVVVDLVDAEVGRVARCSRCSQFHLRQRPIEGNHR